MKLGQNILRSSYRVGLAEEFSRIYTHFYNDVAKLDIGNDIRNFKPKNHKGKILFPLTEGDNGIGTYMFCILAHSARIRGYEPIILVCEKDLDICLRKQPTRLGGDHPSTCTMCHTNGLQYLDAFGLDYTSTSDIPTASLELFEKADYPGEVVYRGVRISDYAESSTKKFLRKGQINHQSKYEMRIYTRMLNSAKTLVEKAHCLLEEHNFHAIIAQHPTYIYGGVFLDLAERYDVPSITFGRGQKKKCITFGNAKNRSALPLYEDYDIVRNSVSTPLNKLERSKLKSFMQSRIAEGGQINYQPKTDEYNEHLLFDEDSPMACMFTNLVWDASLNTQNILFDDYHDWIAQTIQRIRDHEDIILLVKPHPAEYIIGTNDKIADFINEAFESLPANVKILDSDTNINTYQLMKYLDYGIVYNSTVGLEMAYAGIPVIVAGETHYRGLGFTYDPDTVDEYLRLITSPDQLKVDDEMLQRAMRYMYFQFFRKNIRFPFYETSGKGLGSKHLPVYHEDLTHGNRNIDLIFNKIEAKEPIIYPRKEAN